MCCQPITLLMSKHHELGACPAWNGISYFFERPLSKLLIYITTVFRHRFTFAETLSAGMPQIGKGYFLSLSCSSTWNGFATGSELVCGCVNFLRISPRQSAS